MQNATTTLAGLTVAAVFLAGCASTPERIEELEAARTAVLQVETSPRVGAAAMHVSDARQALDRADKLAKGDGGMDDIQYEARIALMNAQIASQKIGTAQARAEIEKANAQRESVLAEARAREAKRAAERAQNLQQRAETLQEELADLRAKQTDRGVVVTLGDVLFDTDEATLKPGAYRTMDRVAEVLKASPDRNVLIEGHTDSRGTAEYNQALSERRAAAVLAALFERGVPASKIRTMGRGESTPIASNDNAGGRQQNRRVELIFQNDSQLASDTQ